MQLFELEVADGESAADDSKIVAGVIRGEDSMIHQSWEWTDIRFDFKEKNIQKTKHFSP